MLQLPALAKSIEVFADNVEYDLTHQTTVFQKNVKVSFDKYEATCQKATVKVNPKTRKVTQIIMQGTVLIKKGKSVFKSQEVIFDAQKNKLFMKGQIYSRIQTDQQWGLKFD